MKNPTLTSGLLLILVSVACSSSSDVIVPSVEDVFPDGETVRLSRAPVQCGGNPWQRENKTIEEYFRDLGVTLLELRLVQHEARVCMACSCPNGERLDVLVFEESVALMLELGFVRHDDWPYDWGAPGS
ncbi:MAG: hypothetical protein GY716_04715 [bacterium]|nr:hypothetical protein [bacterium]